MAESESSTFPQEPKPLAPWLARQLEHLLRQKGHAWLISGPSGLGQYSLGEGLAKAWLCEQPSSKGACGQCSSCRGFVSRTNPDLFVLMPEVLMIEHEWPLEEKVQKELDDKKRKPSQEIKVDAARSLVGFSQISRSGGVGKVAWIHPADRMNSVTANTLLKTLEEPPEGFRFVLTSGAAHELLPTIRSRCQNYTLEWPSQAESIEWLTQEGIKSKADAEVWLRASGGRAEDALLWAQVFKHNAKSWVDLPRSLANGDAGLLSELSGKQTVNVMQKVCHDMMCLSQGAEPKFFPSQSLSPKAQLNAMTEWSKALLVSAQTADHPFNLGLMHEALASQAKGFLNQLA